MAITYTDNGGGAPNGSDLEFTYTFPVIQTEDVKVALNGVTQATTKYAVDNVSNPTKITFNNTSVDSSVQNTSGAPKSGVRVRVYRETTVGKANGDEDPKAVFAAGSSIRAIDLNANQEQSLMAIHELQTRPIETEDIQDDAVTSAKIADATIVEGNLANSAITSNKIADNAVTTTEILNGAVTRDKVASTAIDESKIATNAVTNAKIDDNAVTASKINNGSIITAKIADDAVTSEKINGGAITASHLGTNAVTTVKISSEAVTTAKIQDTAVTTAKIADNAVTMDKIADATIVTQSEQSSHTVNDNTFYTTAAAEARFFNTSSGETIKDGVAFPDNDTTIATTAAINDRIIDLVDDVGGFVPIANETSFPTSNPDVNNGTGTLVSVKSISSTRTPSSGTVTIANGAGTGNTVTITGCGSTVLSAGFGIIVETTSTLHTYAFHRLVPKATEVTTVAGISSNITSVANNATNITAVANNATNINAVAADATDIGAVAAKATEIGRLGTADAVADMAILGTADVVADMAILGTTDVVADLNTLGTADVVADLNTLGTADVVSDMNSLATTANINAMSTCSTNISSINNASSNISSVNNFGDTYQVSANDPSTDGGGNTLAEGDLYFNTSANRLKVYNGSSWVNGVEISGSGAVTTGNTFTGDNRYNDGVKALFGTGSDFEIYHTGSHAILKNSTNYLYYQATQHRFENAGSNELQLATQENAGVELYYDNSKKLHTTSGGIYVTGNIQLPDDGELKLGNSGDLSIYHNDGLGSSWIYNNTGPLHIRSDSIFLRSSSDGASYVNCTDNGAVDLYYNGSKKLETTSAGTTITGALTVDNAGGDAVLGQHLSLEDNGKVKVGTGDDLAIFHDGSNSYIEDSGTGSLFIESNARIRLRDNTGAVDFAQFINGGGVELYHNNSKKFETTSGGADVTGRLTTDGVFIGDGGNNDTSLSIGASNDLRVYHDGSNSYILERGTGNLNIQSDNTVEIEKADGTDIARFHPDGEVELFHNGSKKFETTSTGAKVTGRADVTGDLYVDTDTFRVNSSLNRVSIGGTSASSNLHIHTSTSEGLRLQSTNAASNFIRFTDNSNGSVGYIGHDTDFKIANQRNTNTILYANNTAYLTIQPDGDVGIGTTTPQSGGLTVEKSGEARLQVRANSDGSNGIVALRADGTNTQIGTWSDHDLKFVRNSSTKLELLAGGAKVTGTATATGSLIVGSGNDLQVTRSGGNTEIQNYNGTLLIANASSNSNAVYLRARADENSITMNYNGGVLLYEDNTYKFKTGVNGDYGSVTASNGKNGWSGYSIDGAAVFMSDGNTTGLYNDTDNEWFVDGYRNSAARLRYNGVEKVTTTSAGFKSTGTGQVEQILGSTNAGGVVLYLDGDADGDASGSDYSYIQHDTAGVLRFRNRKNANIAFGTNDVERWYIANDGHLRPEGNNSYDIGSTSQRVRNIYTNDLHLSNEGHSNDVDGTWGDWTIQEGESDLFLKNNRSGKKYKFNLMEVS